MDKLYEKENLEKLKKFLPPKYAAKAVEVTGYSDTLVYDVLKGKKRNQKVMEVLVKLAEENKAKLESMVSSIDKL
jgi:hypothetical protein